MEMFFLSLSRGALLELDPLDSLEEERPRLLPPFEDPLDLPLPFFGLLALSASRRRTDDQTCICSPREQRPLSRKSKQILPVCTLALSLGRVGWVLPATAAAEELLVGLPVLLLPADEQVAFDRFLQEFIGLLLVSALGPSVDLQLGFQDLRPLDLLVRREAQ
jgi:hypothetical protein